MIKRCRFRKSGDLPLEAQFLDNFFSFKGILLSFELLFEFFVMLFGGNFVQFVE